MAFITSSFRPLTTSKAQLRQVCPRITNTSSKSSSWITPSVPLPTTSFFHQRHLHTKNNTITMTTTMTEGTDLLDFSLPTNGGGTLTADEIKTGPTIVYFYPRDATPGCTTEAKDFRDLKEELDGLGAKVVGVSKDSVESHDKFVAKHELSFPLISDDGTLVEGFGVWKMKNVMGNKKMGIERSTFVVKDGKVVKEWRAVKSTGHAAAVVEFLKDYMK